MLSNGCRYRWPFRFVFGYSEDWIFLSRIRYSGQKGRRREEGKFYKQFENNYSPDSDGDIDVVNYCGCLRSKFIRQSSEMISFVNFKLDCGAVVIVLSFS